MSDPAPDRDPVPRRPPPDEAFAEAYAQGFGDGLRDGLKEILQHASRGHTAQELRWLIESRLARVPEEVAFKRRSVLAPPPRTVWAEAARSSAPPSSPPAPPLVFGASYLFREERPERALDLLRRHAARYPRVAVVSLHPPEMNGLPADRVDVIRLGSTASGGGPEDRGPTPGEIGGRLRTAMEAEGGAVVYLDAVEFLVTEFGIDPTMRFVSWLTTQVNRTGSVAVASVDPQTLTANDLHRLQRGFTNVS